MSWRDTCDVCGLREFYLEGGYYYCSICNTQSQQSRHFVEEEQEFNPGAFRSAVTRLQVDEPESAGRTKESAVKLSSWEVYNIVLKTMADRLVEAGYPRILKSKVLELYTDYLKRREAIFVSTTVSKLSAVSLSEPKMNIYALYGKTPRQRLKWGTKDVEKKREREARLDQTNNVGVGSMRKLKAQAKRRAFIKEYLEKSHASDSASQEPSISNKTRKFSKAKKKEARLMFTQSLRQVRATVPSGKKVVPGSARPHSLRLKKIFQPETFTMKSVLILIFVALRQIGCKVLFSDILRLSTEGILKIESITSILHAEEIKLLDLNCDRFVKKKNFDLQRCGDSIEVFLTYMAIENFPYPLFTEFIPKFMDHLKLPREFECLLSQLNKKNIKLDWLLYHREADKVIKQQKVSLSDGVSISTVVSDNFHQDHLKKSTNSKAVTDSCNAIKSIFSEICATSETDTGVPPVHVQPQPQIMSTGIPREDVIQAYTRAQQNSWLVTKSSLDTLVQNFAKSRIDYIFDPSKYIPILSKAGYKVKVIAGDARNADTKLCFKGNTIPLFQPYKLYNDFTSDDTSESLNYLISLYSDVFAGSNFESVQRHIRSNIDCIEKSTLSTTFSVIFLKSRRLEDCS
ncbi:unnamed protein product [Allacma fusca]|uniref:TATA box-binding protein-associated factor RNA polymerase I subunit B n=1 Tax=Allacma fusca TaxID=39272 RepID=A0A8J2P5D9_9HEXA|nr:unnamed protein product [Allacma fusca]